MFFFYLTIQASCYHHFPWLQTQVAGLTGHRPRSFGPSQAGIPSLGPGSPGHCIDPGGLGTLPKVCKVFILLDVWFSGERVHIFHQLPQRFLTQKG